MAYQLIYKKLRYLLGILRIGKLALHREGVGGEPLQQLFAKGADHLGLRIVNVGINEPRQQQLTPQIDIALQGMQKGFPLLPWQQGDNFPLLQEQQAIIEIAGLGGHLIRGLRHAGDIKKCTAHRGLVIHHRTCLLLTSGNSDKQQDWCQFAACRGQTPRQKGKVTLFAPPRRSGRRLSPALHARREPASGRRWRRERRR